MKLLNTLANRKPVDTPKTPRPAGSLMASMGGFKAEQPAATPPTPPMPSTETPLPSIPSRVPPQWDRYVTAEKMKDSYLNGWNPNPLLVRLMGK